MSVGRNVQLLRFVTCRQTRSNCMKRDSPSLNSKYISSRIAFHGATKAVKQNHASSSFSSKCGMRAARPALCM